VLGATFRRNGAGAPLRCDCVCKVRADEAGPAGDDVAHEEFMAAGMFRGFRIELGPSCLPEAGRGPKNRIGVSFNVASEHPLVR